MLREPIWHSIMLSSIVVITLSTYLPNNTGESTPLAAHQHAVFTEIAPYQFTIGVELLYQVESNLIKFIGTLLTINLEKRTK